MSNPILDELMHYGMPRRSGRYPWGSGENPFQHEDDFLKYIHEKREEEFEYTENDPESKDYGKTFTGDLAIAKSLGLTSSQFRTQLSLANSKKRQKNVERAKKLREEGKSLNEIAEIMGYENDSSVRSLLNENSESRMLAAETTADILRQQVADKGMILVGKGADKVLGVSPERLKTALYILEMEGYPTYGIGIPQVTNPGQETRVKVLCPPGTHHKEAYQYDKLHTIDELNITSNDGGQTFNPKWVYPESLDSKRLSIRYAEDGGKQKDGVMEIRPGVKDLDLGGARYSQVRIMVDGTHYLKGMAIYGDPKDFPPGVDVIFNTNKSSDVPVMGPKSNSVLKPIKDDPRNPFGSLIKEGINDPEKGTTGGGQSYYIDSDGKKKLSLINKRSDEGDWGEWADKIPSQFLAKQSQQLIDKQLALSEADKKAEFDEIMALTNPTVKKAMLKSFADDCDATAVHLKAAALPRQSYQVILPLTTISDDEVYAPNYRQGEKVALVRYPHGGTFEIPILTVNNELPEGKKLYGTNPKDAVGISKSVAERLSGADFDGDTVMVIPCNNPRSSVKIVSTPKLFDEFDDVLEYGGKPEGSFKKMNNTQNEMGVVSNLIMDMTLKGANTEELARAVKHSMVIIDAEKHGLDYKQSEKDFGIAELKKRYQGHIGDDGKYHEGASTLITLAKSPKDVLKTVGSPRIDPETGKVYWPEDKIVREEYIDKKGNVRVRTKKSTKMAETDDAHTLSTGTTQEEAYADYANYMKNLANEARKEMVNTKDIQYSPSAKAAYANEVKKLEADLNLAILNKPKEQLAQAKANAIVAQKRKADPDLKQKDLKKIRQQALVDARASTGAMRHPIDVTPKQWEAIQAGAISANKLTEIMQFMNDEQLKQYATPKTTNREISPTKKAKIIAMAAQGYTPSEIADATGLSTSTVHKYSNS